MSWPLSEDYNEAIQDPPVAFSDPELKTGEAVGDALGIPLPRTGNFADVYEFQSPGGNKWAIKCFTRSVPGLRERYREIARHLGQASLPFTVDFQFLEQGIRIRGDWYPVLKMRWVEGLLLNQYVREAIDKKQHLEALTHVWARLARRLRDADLAHADLQHGNVLLVPARQSSALSVKLVDYDGMFVPSLAEQKSGEAGHPAYQHPQRLPQAIYSAEVDRFPLLLVYCALRALEVGGRALWDSYDTGENILFREKDIQQPGNSALFKELWQFPDEAVRNLVGHLALAALAPLEKTPLLDKLLKGDGDVLPLRRREAEQATELLGKAAVGNRQLPTASNKVRKGKANESAGSWLTQAPSGPVTTAAAPLDETVTPADEHEQEYTEPPALTLGEGRLGGQGYSLIIHQQGRVRSLIIETPERVLYDGPEPGGILDRPGVQPMLAGITIMVALGLVEILTGFPLLWPTLFGLAVAVVLFLAGLFHYYQARSRPDAALLIDAAWTMLTPQLLSEKLTARKLAFLTGLARVSVGQGDPAPRAKIVESARQTLASSEDPMVVLSQGALRQLVAADSSRATRHFPWHPVLWLGAAALILGLGINTWRTPAEVDEEPDVTQNGQEKSAPPAPATPKVQPTYLDFQVRDPLDDRDLPEWLAMDRFRQRLKYPSNQQTAGPAADADPAALKTITDLPDGKRIAVLHGGGIKTEFPDKIVIATAPASRQITITDAEGKTTTTDAEPGSILQYLIGGATVTVAAESQALYIQTGPGLREKIDKTGVWIGTDAKGGMQARWPTWSVAASADPDTGAPLRIFSLESVLSPKDAKDRIRPDCQSHVHDLKMAAGCAYKIDLICFDFVLALRLEDAKDKELARDNDQGKNRAARIAFQPEITGVYRVIVSSVTPGKTGRYRLRIGEQQQTAAK